MKIAVRLTLVGIAFDIGIFLSYVAGLFLASDMYAPAIAFSLLAMAYVSLAGYHGSDIIRKELR